MLRLDEYDNRKFRGCVLHNSLPEDVRSTGRHQGTILHPDFYYGIKQELEMGENGFTKFLYSEPRSPIQRRETSDKYRNH